MDVGVGVAYTCSCRYLVRVSESIGSRSVEVPKVLDLGLRIFRGLLPTRKPVGMECNSFSSNSGIICGC